MVVGFFRKILISDIEEHLDDEKVRFSYQAIDLYRWARGEIDGVGISVAQGMIWIVAPAGPMEEMERTAFEEVVGPCPYPDVTPKLVPVTVLHAERLTHAPTLLAQITANRHLSSSTFKEITDDFGNQLALDHVLFKGGLLSDYPHLAGVPRNMYHLLQCLGPNELIALIARLFEEHGLHVPAPTGGFVKNVDIIAYNDSSRDIDVMGVTIPRRQTFRAGAIAIQVRGILQDLSPDRSPEVDYTVQLNGAPAPDGHRLNCDWIEAALAASPATTAWLRRVLRWVPFSGSLLGPAVVVPAAERQP